jgi:hypothetical protein
MTSMGFFSDRGSPAAPSGRAPWGVSASSLPSASPDSPSLAVSVRAGATTVTVHNADECFG